MRNRIITYGLFILILCIFCVFYYHKVITMYPAYMHDWAQADRLSLAINFHDGGMNFFKPATHNLGPKDGVVGVEFPIQSYLAAALGFVFGRAHISICFRMLDILISCTGLFFLFLTCYKATKDFIVSALPPLFIFCSPIYVFYSGTYIPDTAATSIIFIAFYYIFSYIQSPNDKTVLKIITLLTLAGLIKTSTAYCLIAFAGLALIQQLTNYKSQTILHRIQVRTWFIPAFGIIAVYYFYNQYLNKTHGSFIFWATINPFSDFADAKLFYETMFLTYWIREYLQMPQYYILAAIVLPAIYFSLRIKDGRYHLLYFLFLAAGSCGLICLFGKQLWFHDYYIISMVFPTIVYLLLLSVVYIVPYTNRKYVLPVLRTTVLIVLLFLLIPSSIKQARARTSEGYGGANYGLHWAAKGKKTLDSLKLPKNIKIAVLDEDAPNLALVHLDRRGYHIPPSTWINDMSMTNDILNIWRIRILVCKGSLGKRLQATDVGTAWFFVPLAITNDIAIFYKKRLPPVAK